jgi:hypothetical protein
MTSSMPKFSPAEVAAPPNGSVFEQQAAAVMERLRNAMSAVIEGIPVAGRIKRASDLQRVLGIGSTLSWQVFRVATAANPIEEGRGVPGSTAMERFIEAAAKRGVPTQPIAELRAAVEDFQEVVRVHAGSRATFDSMLGGLSQNGADELDLMHKRAAFRANSHFLGARAKATLGVLVCQPAATDENMIDALTMKGLVGLSTQRRTASWGLTTLRLTNDDGTPRQVEGIAPLDPAGASNGIAFFRDFCSKPLPQFKVIKKRDGCFNVRVDGELIDQQSAMTLILAFVCKGMNSRYRTAEDTFLSSAPAMRIPSEVLIHDIIVRDDLFPQASPEVGVFHDFNAEPFGEPHRDHDRLPMSESVIYLGRGLDVLETPELPRYREMMQEAMRRLAWDPSRFDVYRCRVEFPIVPSLLRIKFDLPERPA